MWPSGLFNTVVPAGNLGIARGGITCHAIIREYIRRLEQELSIIRQDPPEQCSAQPCDEDITSRWTATIDGPADSPYRHGVFKLDISFPEGYPNQPPSVKFLTKVYHPNVDADSGFIGLNILHEEWSPALTVCSILLSLRALLSDPDPVVAVSPEIAHQYVTERAEYNIKAEQWTHKFAYPSPQD